MNKNNGWLCVRCGASNSPAVKKCECSPKTILEVNGEDSVSLDLSFCGTPVEKIIQEKSECPASPYPCPLVGMTWRS